MMAKSGLNLNPEKELLFISPFQRKLNLKKQTGCVLPVDGNEYTNLLNEIPVWKAGSTQHMQQKKKQNLTDLLIITEATERMMKMYSLLI